MSFDNEHYWHMAEHIYSYGKNVVTAKSNVEDDDSFYSIELISLQSLATSSLRSGTLFYDEFLAYNEDNPFYGF